MLKRVFLCFCATFLLPIPILGSVIYTDYSHTADSLTIGDRIDFRVSIIYPSGMQVSGPEVDTGFGDFVVKQWHDESVSREHSDSATFFYTITTYKTGLCTIPALPFYVSGDSTQDTLLSRPIPLPVASVVTADTATPRDIKPPLAAGRRSLWWVWTLTALGLMAGAGIIGKSLLARSRSQPPPPPPKPPYEEAMEALAALKSKDLLKKGLIREHIFELSEILKRYAGRRYNSPVAEFTTEEIIEWLEDAPFEEKLRDSMIWFFETSHPVKFARIIPTQENLQALCEKAEDFIIQTKPVPETGKKPQTREVTT
ncbi:MAG: hypothetical protein ACOC41_02385 [Chitinivibrionales bacterium]